MKPTLEYLGRILYPEVQCFQAMHKVNTSKFMSACVCLSFNYILQNNKSVSFMISFTWKCQNGQGIQRNKEGKEFM